MTWLWTLDPERGEEAAGERAGGDAGGGLAGAGALEHVADVAWPYFWAPTRSAWPGRGRWTSSGSNPSTGQGFIRSSQLA